MATNNDNCSCVKKVTALEKIVKELEAKIATLIKVIKCK